MTLSLVGDTDVPGDRRAVLSLDLEGVARGRTEVLGAIRLEVRPGETLAIVGPSGIGKTTLLRVVAGLMSRYRGRCVTSARKAIVFQEPRLLPWRTLAQNLAITTGIGAETAAQYLAEAGLEGRGSDYPGELSLGQARRVAIVRAFAVRPELLLMDEPFASLDAASATKMMALFDRLRARTSAATLFVTHVEAEARQLASRIVTLGGQPAAITDDRQNSGANFQLSASGVTSAGS